MTPNSTYHAQTAEDQTPPNSVEAEEAALGSVLMNPESYHEVASFLNATDFYIARHMWIWDAIAALFERGDAVDNLTVMRELQTRGQLEDVGGPSYITYLLNNTPTHVHVVTYARIVERAAVRRRLLNAAGHIAQMALEEDITADECVNRAEATIFAVTEQRQGVRFVPMREANSAYYDQVMDGIGNKVKGIPTGFADIDAVIGGCRRGESIILAARPGVGKTSLMLNMASNMADPEEGSGLRVGILSIEMTINELMNRLYSIETGINSSKLRDSTLDEREQKLFTDTLPKMGKRKIFVADPSTITLPQIQAAARRLYREHGLDILFIDYLGLVNPDKRAENTAAEVSIVSQGIKALAKELRIPIITACQMSRAIESRSDKRPMLSDLRSSGSIEQDADIVMFLHRPEMYDENTDRPNQADVHIEKDRNDKTGVVSLYFQKELTRFQNLKRNTINLSDF